MRITAYLVAFLIFLGGSPAWAQSPNTATVVVIVTDQSGAVVDAAQISVINTETGATRETASGSDGSATIAALSLTGRYTIKVSKNGFATEELPDLVLRAGETATLRVRLLVGTVEERSHGLRNDGRRSQRSAARHATRQRSNRRSAHPGKQDHLPPVAELRIPQRQRHR